MATQYSLRKPFSPLSRVCRVARDPQQVTTIGEEASAASLGLDATSLEAIWSAALDLYASGTHPAIQIAIRHRGELVLHRAVGFARGGGPEARRDTERVPVTLDTPFTLYSASKAITAFLVLKLDEIGELDIEDRVSEWIPEFAQKGKRDVTIRHVLTHRSGLPSVPLTPEFWLHPERTLEDLCAFEPSTRPGKSLAYHAVSGGLVLAELMRRATGKDARALIREHFSEPLGLRWLDFGIPKPADQVALADDAHTGLPVVPPLSWLLNRALGESLDGVTRAGNTEGFRASIMPSANAVATASEMATFYSCLAAGGSWQGRQILDPRTIRLATTEESFYEVDWTLGTPMRWGLGVMLGDAVSLFGLNTRQAFGHLGFTNILTWGDPARELGVAILTSGKPAVSAGIPSLVKLVHAIGQAFPRKS